MKKNTKKFLKGILLVSLALSSAAAFGGCGKSGSLKVAVIGKKLSEGSSYWSIIRKGAEDAGAETGIDVVYDGPQEAVNLEQQIALINKYVDEGYSAIVIAPVDKDAVNDAINAAGEKIPVIAIDSDATAENKKTCISTDNVIGGEAAAGAAIKLIGSEGKVGIISDSESAQNTLDRIKGFTDKAESENIEVYDVQYCNSDRETSKKLAGEMLDSEGGADINLMFGANESSTLGICDAVKERNLEDTVSVVGFDCSNDVVNFMREGVIDATTVQNPYNMGYLGVKYAQKSCNGETIESVVDTGVTIVNPDNLDDEDIKFLINPLGN
ncbi:MAG: substrate-binding domain-containing protein [Ruminococcus sp.]|nr:substrate-binding domain-containing protein [Ruminococcus sp.]